MKGQPDKRSRPGRVLAVRASECGVGHSSNTCIWAVGALHALRIYVGVSHPAARPDAPAWRHAANVGRHVNRTYTAAPLLPTPLHLKQLHKPCPPHRSPPMPKPTHPPTYTPHPHLPPPHITYPPPHPASPRCPQENFLVVHDLVVTSRGSSVLRVEEEVVTAFAHRGKMTDLHVRHGGWWGWDCR